MGLCRYRYDLVNWLNKIHKMLDDRAMLMHHEQVQSEIDGLHQEIDMLSIRLGKLVKLKFEIEMSMMAEQRNADSNDTYTHKKG